MTRSRKLALLAYVAALSACFPSAPASTIYRSIDGAAEGEGDVAKGEGEGDLAGEGEGDVPQNACVSDPQVDAAPSYADTDGSFAAAQAWLDEMVADQGVPGASVAVVVDGQLAWASATGVLRQGQAARATQDTTYVICSVTKMMTAGALMTTVDDGIIALDDAVTVEVPELQLSDGFDPSSITTRELLEQTSGLPDTFDESCGNDDDALARFFRDRVNPLWSPPGRLYNYSNQGFALAGLVLERAAGEPYRCAMRDRVFDPAGMGTFTFDPSLAMAREHAVGSSVDDTGAALLVEPDRYSCGAMAPAGFAFGTALDVAHYAEVLLAGGSNVMSSESAADLQAGHVDTGSGMPWTQYGYGLASGDYNGEHVVWHDGSAPGFTTALWMVPARRLAVVVLENGEGDAVSVAAVIANELLGLPQTDFVDDSAPASTWRRYTGTYVDPFALGTITVALGEDGKLTASFDVDGSEAELQPFGGDEFLMVFDGEPWDGATFFFDEGAPDHAQYFATREGVGARTGDDG